VVLGELSWIALRLTTVAGAFTVVMAAFGVPRSPLVLAAIPAAVLTGLAFAAPIVAYAATLKAGGTFNQIFRFGITPMFLFSGTFFPVSQLPAPLQPVAAATPLFHGVELVRGLALGTIGGWQWTVHVAYLVSFVAAGTAIALRTFERKLRA
jgi:lipooligosaccharide transport system permease protein